LQLGNFSLPPLSIRHLHAAPPLLQVAVRLIVVRGLRMSKIGESHSSKFVFEIKSAILTDWRDDSFSCADFDNFGKSPISQVALGTN
jgi:hypothetical protein